VPNAVPSCCCAHHRGGNRAMWVYGWHGAYGMATGVSKVHGNETTIQADRHVLEAAEAVCTQVVREAGAVLASYFRAPLAVEFKEKNEQSPVTEADRRSEDLLREALSRAFPDHGIIGEEKEDVVNPGADYVWFLDPLDGTTNFTAGFPAFAISMGLCFHGVPVLGVVSIPWEGPEGTIFRAHQGGGAYCNDRAIHVAPAEVPKGTRLISMPFWALWQYRVHRRSAVRGGNVRASGSIAYELVYAACGTFQLSVISGARLWDMMAGAALIEEAGGAILCCNGKARRWQPWGAFLQRALDAPFGTDLEALRKLNVYMLVGNPEVVQKQVGRIGLRRPLPGVGKAKRQMQKAWRGLVSRPSVGTDAKAGTAPQT
jgi:myo-inositol-1(or 4)-monophosphatase